MNTLPAKPVRESAVRDQVDLIFPNDLNSHGTLFGGRVLDLADRLAGVVARRHSGRICVTLGIDSVRFLAPATIHDTLIFEAAVNRVWRTSLEIGLKAFAEDFRTQARRHVFSAYFTYVALDDQDRPVEIPPVLPETDDEKRRYAQADQRRIQRLAGTAKRQKP